MASPSSSLATLRPDLSRSLKQFDLAADRVGFVGDRICPPLNVYEAGGNYGVIPLEQLLQTKETRRANDGSYNKADDFDFVPTTYQTVERGLESRVDDNQSAMFAGYFDQYQIKADRTLDMILRNQEIRVTKMVTDTSVFTGSLTVSPTYPWTNILLSTPMDDMVAWCHQFWLNCGLWPNKLCLSKMLFDYLRRNKQIIEQIKYGGLEPILSSQMTAEFIAQALNIDEVVVAGSARNTGNPQGGATLTPTSQQRNLATIWPRDKAILCRTADGEDPQEPCFARNFYWDESAQAYTDEERGGGGAMPVVEVYRSEERRGNIIRVRHQCQQQVYYKQANLLATVLWPSDGSVEGWTSDPAL